MSNGAHHVHSCVITPSQCTRCDVRSAGDESPVHCAQTVASASEQSNSIKMVRSKIPCQKIMIELTSPENDCVDIAHFFDDPGNEIDK